MIRAFTISFDFDGKTYLALATIKKKENQPYFSVRVLDDTIGRFLPDGCIQYSEVETKMDELTKHPHAQRLFLCIKESVDAHLQSANI